MDLTIVINTYKDHIKYFKKCVSNISIHNNIKLLVIIDEKSEKYKTLISKILKKKKFKNFRVILNRQRGISSARNKAIKLCNTKWLTFLDGDDYIYNKKIKFNFLNKNYDFFILNSQLSNNNKTEFYTKDTNIITKLQKINFFKKYLIKPRGNSVVTHTWSKIYNLRFLRKNKIYFKNNLDVNEDFLFNSRCFLKARKIKLFKKKKLVFHNVANITRTKTRHFKLDQKNYTNPIKNIIKIIPKKDQKFFFKAAVKYWEGKISFLKEIHETDKKYRKES